MATLAPAYGRVYKSKEEVLKDWNLGKDFQYHEMLKEAYVNKDDCPKGEHQFKDKGDRNVMLINVT